MYDSFLDEPKQGRFALRAATFAASSILGLTACFSTAMCDTIIVSQDGTGDFETIQEAISSSADGDSIFVTAGIYFESELTVSLPITIEGDMGSDGLPAVTLDSQGGSQFYMNSTSEESSLRNFILTGSNETGSMCFHSTPTFVNCTFIDNGAEEPGEFNLGGAMYNLNGAPVFIDCRFIGNRGGFGGAFSTWESGPDPSHHPLFVRCLFKGNSGHWGGAMANLRSNPTLIDCTFEDNTAFRSGGAILNDGFDGPDFWISRPVLENCSFTGNSAIDDGGAITNMGSSESTITNCQFSLNTAQVAGAIMNTGMSFSTLTDTTLCGNMPDQIIGTWHDMGGNSILLECLPPCPGDLNGDGIVDGADLSALLGDWNQAGSAADIDGDGLVDGFDLTLLLGSWGLCS